MRDFKKFTLLEDSESITTDHTAIIPPPKPTWYEAFLEAASEQFTREMDEYYDDLTKRYIESKKNTL